MQLLSYDYYPDALKREADRVLNGLERVETRNTRLYSPDRQYERKEFRGTITLKLADDNHPALTLESQCFCEVLARDISQGGLSFIYPGEIARKLALVGIHLPNKTTRWFHGRIVRARLIGGERFWEYGVSFAGVVQDNQEAPTSRGSAKP